MSGVSEAEMKNFSDEMARKTWNLQKNAAEMNLEISKAKNYGNAANRAAKEGVAQ